jgi:alkylmercury lyase
MDDRRNAARVAWATIKLSQVGQRPVSLDQLATQLGLTAVETARLLHLTWQERVDLRDGMVRLDLTPAGPRRYRVHAGGRPVGTGKGCSVDMYLLALALGRPIHAEAVCPATGTAIRVDITPDRVERIDPPGAVVAVVNLDADLTLGLDRTDADVCAQQPFFASAQAASGWLVDHPQGRLIPVRSFHAEARRLVDRLEATPPATPNDVNAAGGDRS